MPWPRGSLCFALVAFPPGGVVWATQPSSHSSVSVLRPAVSMASRRTEVATGAEHELDQTETDVDQSMDDFAEQTLSSMIEALLLEEGPTTDDLLKAAESKMRTKDALRRLKGKIPDSLSSLLHRTLHKKHGTDEKHEVEDEDAATQPDENTLAQARGILNGMVESATAELDARIIECKEFEARNRETDDQIKTDIARIGEDIADLERLRTEANQGISSKITEVEAVKSLYNKGVMEYNRVKATDQAEMLVRQNDLSVAEFVMKLTKCADVGNPAPDFMQTTSSLTGPPRICEVDGRYELHLADHRLQAKFERMLTPNARTMFHKTMARMLKSEEGLPGAAGLLQFRSLTSDDPEDEIVDQDVTEEVSDGPEANAEEADVGPEGAGVVTTFPTAVPLAAVAAASTAQGGGPMPNATTFVRPSEKVMVNPDKSVQWKKCVDAPPDCGTMHDAMALMWGRFKDQVDELQMEMELKDTAFVDFKKSSNEQLQMLGSAKNVFNKLLGEAVSNMNGVSEESEQKVLQQRSLEKAYNKEMKVCQHDIQELMYTNICACRKVRNSLMRLSTVSPPENIVDCDTGQWVPEPCSMSCDDTCPQADPFACGGFQKLTREVLVSPNEFGVKCPVLAMQRKCSQVKCPVDCVLSMWSGWGECTKECGGGVQGHTRSVLTKARNGGRACDTVQEERACHTGSCDRDCTLSDWTSWDPCSMACGGGMQERSKNVLVPIRGLGKCPASKSPQRTDERVCNSQECVGDEVCIAHQDLVLAIDSSGSLGNSGHHVIRKFASKLIERFSGMHFGDDAMKVGVVQFGNGAVEANDTISRALNIQPLTSDMDAVGAAIAGLTWQKGFTNMAQALTLADTMITQGGRFTAQSAVMMITDAKPSFIAQTERKVQALKEKNIKLFIAPILKYKGNSLRMMRQFASAPWETHLVRIPGLGALTADVDVYVEKCVATFCPKAMSPSMLAETEEQQRFLLVRTGGRCGERGEQLADKLSSPHECKRLAHRHHYHAFSFGVGDIVGGRCWAETLEVTPEIFEYWRGERVDPQCPEGGWHKSKLSDFYAIEPDVSASLAAKSAAVWTPRARLKR